jgi:O-antigen ligase
MALGHERVPSLLGYDFVDRWDRFSGTFRDPNMAGGYLVLSLFVLSASPWPRRGWVKVLLALPILVAIQATRSNTALFALAAGVAVAITVSVIRSRRTAIGLAFGLSACALVALAVAPSTVVAAPANVARSLGETETFSGSLGRFDSSLGARLDRMSEALQLFGPQVLIGIGPSTTKHTLLTRGASIGGEMHNDYVAALVERGVLGVLGVLGVMSTALWTAVTLGRRSVASRMGWATSALAGGVAAIIVIAMGLEALHFRHIWMFFALVFALSLLEQQGRALMIDPTEATASRRWGQLGE